MQKLTVEISIYCDPRLKDRLGALADSLNLSLSECCAQLLARQLNRPELGHVPRKKFGRPLRKIAGS